MYVFLNNTGMTYVLLVLLGLVVGSFVSAITYRIPRGLGFIKGRSFCDSCKKELRWFDNIPLFSFLFYGGAARCCGKKISIRYPLIEIVTLLGVVVVWFLSSSFVFIVLYLLTLTILIIDLEHQFIPDELSFAVLILFLLVSNNPLFSGLFAGFLCAFLLLLIHLITHGRGMGLGDVKLAIALGMWLGLERGFTWLMASFILGGIVAAFLLVLKKAKLKSKIAFGPFLIIAFWIVFLTLLKMNL